MIALNSLLHHSNNTYLYQCIMYVCIYLSIYPYIYFWFSVYLHIVVVSKYILFGQYIYLCVLVFTYEEYVSFLMFVYVCLIISIRVSVNLYVSVYLSIHMYRSIYLKMRLSGVSLLVTSAPSRDPRDK